MADQNHLTAADAAATNESKNEMPTTYDPKAAEQKWYSYWTEGGYFRACLNVRMLKPIVL